MAATTTETGPTEIAADDYNHSHKFVDAWECACCNTPIGWTLTASDDNTYAAETEGPTWIPCWLFFPFDGLFCEECDPEQPN